MIKSKAIIIGGGASGTLAAIIAKDLGGEIAIIEGENRITKKLLITGNGRCNISNINIQPPYINYHSKNNAFFKSVLNQFSVNETIDLFRILGLPLISLEEGRLYPQSLQASSVVDTLLINIEERNIPVYLNSKVINISKKDDLFLIETSNENNRFFKAEKILIACGGKCNPQTGSDGSIYSIMQELRHRIIKPLPAIVQLKLQYQHLKAISGVRFNALAKVYVNKELKRSEFDEVLFTDYGISGPAILQCSRYAAIGLEENKTVEISLDLFPKETINELRDLFEERFSLLGHRSIMQNLVGVINKKLIPIILKDSGINDLHKSCDSLTYQEKYKLIETLKDWRFKCIDTNGFNNAQVTIGGIDTTLVDENTLESKIIKNLYFAGEVLDVDGDCGGYNLQWAWSSGYVAGKNLI